MKKILFILFSILYLEAEQIGYPKWFFISNNQSKVPVCIRINGSISTARTIAIAKAKVELQRMKKVKLNSEIILEKTSSKNDYNSTFKEVIKEKSEGIIKGENILKSGIFIIDNIKNYCLLYGK
jgi:hypothetical protein